MRSVTFEKTTTVTNETMLQNFIWYPDALSDSLSGILQLRALLNTHIFKTILKVKTTVSVDLIN